MSDIRRRVASLSLEQRVLLARQLEELEAAQGAGDRCLIAYVVPAPGQEIQGAALRYFLLSKLPEYMVPAAFLILDAMPLAANGKIDRRSLPAPDWGRPEPESVAVAPRTLLEERLAEIWKDVLGVESISMHDDFFELGGDSILSLRISAAAREHGLAVTPRKVYEHPTIAELAAGLEVERERA